MFPRKAVVPFLLAPLLAVSVSHPSPAVAAPLVAGTPAPPSGVGSLVLDLALRRNQLRWTPPSDLGEPATVSYRVERQYGFTPYQTVAVTTDLSYVDPNVLPGQQFAYRVTPFNDAGDGPTGEPTPAPGAASSLLTVSKQPGVDSGLYLVARNTSALVPLLADSTARFTPELSPDGTQVVYAQSTVAGNPDAETDLWVSSLVDGTAPRQLTSLAGDEGEPSWSPDGRTIAFTHIGSSIEVRTVPAAGGTSVVRVAGDSHPSWLADSSGVVTDNYSTGQLAVVDAAGRRTVISGPVDAYAPRVSPDGARIAYIHDDGVDVSRLAVVAVGGGAPLEQSDTQAWDSPSWGTDSHRVYGERYDANGDPHLGQTAWNPDGYPVPGDVSSDLAATPVDWHPGVFVTSAPTLSTGSATIAFTRPEGGARTECSLDGAAPTTCVTDGRSSGSVSYTGLASGVHRVVIRDYDQSYVADPYSVTAHQWNVDATAPVNTVVAPAVGAVLTPTVTFSYRATDASGVASYDVRYRRAPVAGAYSAYTSPSGWTDTTAASRTLSLTPGNEYCFSMRSQDRLGNVSAWTADRCITSALDDRALVASAGWTRPAVSGAYKNTVTTTTRTGTTLTVRSVQTRRITLVVTKCAACGTVGVYLGTTRIAVVDTRAATTARQVRVALPVLSSVRSGALVLKPLVAGRTVQIDGIAFARA